MVEREGEGCVVGREGEGVWWGGRVRGVWWGREGEGCGGEGRGEWRREGCLVWVGGR